MSFFPATSLVIFIEYDLSGLQHIVKQFGTVRLLPLCNVNNPLTTLEGPSGIDQCSLSGIILQNVQQFENVMSVFYI